MRVITEVIMLKVGTTEAVKVNNDGLKTMKQFLYLLRPTRVGMLTQGPTPFEKDVVARHFSYLSELTDRGVMILVGRTQNNDESAIGIAIFEATDESAARTLMENDPAVAEGVMFAELFPYKVALMRKL